MQILVIIAVIIAIITAILYVLYVIISEHRKKIVLQTSSLLENLLELNSQIDFDWNVKQSYVFTKYLNTKAKFDRYELINLFDETVLNNNWLMKASKAIEKNRNMYKDYLQKICCLKSEVTQDETKKLHISYKNYIKIEQKLFQEKQVKPTLDCIIICVALYSSPKGRNHYSKRAVYKIDTVPQHYEKIQQRIALQNSEAMRRKRARSQMTDKLRYSILKRDGFRCKICGCTADDGVKLHVDHIIPVSKGGETILSNLRTLCETCNLGKSDEIE